MDEKMKEYIKKVKENKKGIAIGCGGLAVVGMLVICSLFPPAETLATGSTAAPTVTLQDKKTEGDPKDGPEGEKGKKYTKEDIKEVITGITDHNILQDAKEIDYKQGVKYDDKIVKSVKVDTAGVDLKKPGTYKVKYIVTVDNEAMEKYLVDRAEKDKGVKGKGTAADELKIKETGTTDITIEAEIKVVDEKTAQGLVCKGETVWSDKNEPVKKGEKKSEEKAEVAKMEEKKDDKGQAANGSQSQAPEVPPVENSQDGNTDPGSVGASGTVEDNEEPEPAPTSAEPVHEHDWVAQTSTVHHEATGHYETQVIQEGYDEPIYDYRPICNGCGADISDDLDHIFWCDPGSYSVKEVQIGTEHHEAITNQVWVQDTGAWDETVTTGYVCSACGAAQ